jgi:transketolase
VTENSLEYEFILRELGRANPAVIVIDAGLATSMKTHLFARAFPERYFNLGIAEQNAVSVASGLARRDLVPLVHTFSNFITRRAHDQVALSVAWPQCNVKLIGGSCGVFDGRNGPSHMAIDDLATMFALPGILIVEPGDRRQTRDLLHAVVSHAGPAYLRLRRHGAAEDLLPGLPVDRGVVVAAQHEKSRATLVAAGSMLGEALQATQLLKETGLLIDLIHVSILRPLYAQPILESAQRTRLVITLENHVASGAVGDAISRHVAPHGLRQIRFALPDEFIPAGDPPWQLAYCGLDADSIADRITHLLAEETNV